MQGFITLSEVTQHEAIIVEVWGADFYLACCNAKEGDTFLGLLVEHGRM